MILPRAYELPVETQFNNRYAFNKCLDFKENDKRFNLFLSSPVEFCVPAAAAPDEPFYDPVPGLFHPGVF